MSTRKRFVFLIHPRSCYGKEFGIGFPPLRLVPESFFERIALKGTLPPLPYAKVYLNDERRHHDGYVRVVPLSGAHMLKHRELAQARVHAAVDQAVKLGARIVGLGALTAPVTKGGMTLASRKDIGVTNGNAFTSAMTLRLVEQLVARCQNREPLVALVGATGSVGSCLCRMMAERRTASRMMLVARDRGRLDALASELRLKNPDAKVTVELEIAKVKQADLIILLTSASEALLRSEHLKEGALVLDDTQPRNTDAELAHSRPDVGVFDGGLVSVPGAYIDRSISLPHGHFFACFAETMLLALDGHEGHFSIGDPRPEQAAYTLELADKYAHLGFRLAPLRSFGRRVGGDVGAGFKAVGVA